MNTIEAIGARRSIRRYADRPVDRALVEQVIQAGIDAPSAKNRQPWRFVVVTEAARAEMEAVIRGALDWRDAHAEGEEEKLFLKGARHTLGIMAQAPVNIFVFNPFGKPPTEPLAPYGERFFEMANIQSTGAAIQNMCLAATALGLGSLWIADVYDSFHALGEWLGTQEQLVASVALGYADEAPAARPRRPLAEVTSWR